MDVNELIKRADSYYLKALELLETKDFYDAAEKAWLAIETLRKAFLVALGVPYDKAKSINYALPLLSKLMRGLGLKTVLRDYEWFHHKLHAMGFYENITPIDEIITIIKEDVKKWIENMKNVIRKINKLDISEVVREYEKAIQVKRELLSKNLELLEIYKNIDTILNKIATTSKLK